MSNYDEVRKLLNNNTIFGTDKRNHNGDVITLSAPVGMGITVTDDPTWAVSNIPTTYTNANTIMNS